MHLLNTKAEDFIRLKLTNELPIISVKPGKCRYNFRCQLNAAHEAIKHKHDKLAMVVYLAKDDTVIIHFINYHNGEYVDNTLGEWTVQNKYMFVKFIYPEDYLNVNDIFTDYRDYLQQCMPPYLRWFSNVTF